jgi:hypothetical protein
MAFGRYIEDGPNRYSKLSITTCSSSSSLENGVLTNFLLSEINMKSASLAYEVFQIVKRQLNSQEGFK